MEVISDQRFDSLLKSGWDQVCYVGYGGFMDNGPGVVAVAIIEGEFTAMYTHPGEGNLVDASVLKMVNEYDPKTQVIVQYLSQPNRVKTIKLEMGSSKDSPYTIWEKHNILVKSEK